MTEKYTGENAPWIGIAPMRLELADSFRECLDSVARERKYLMLTEAPSEEQSREFVEYILEARFPMWIAIVPGPRVVGWCEICPQSYESRSHVGILGVGLHKDFRGNGIGRLLVEQALKQAHVRGIERVELNVYSSNIRARKTYEKTGFVVEGVKRRSRKIDGVYEDNVMMARLF